MKKKKKVSLPVSAAMITVEDLQSHLVSVLIDLSYTWISSVVQDEEEERRRDDSAQQEEKIRSENGEEDEGEKKNKKKKNDFSLSPGVESLFLSQKVLVSLLQSIVFKGRWSLSSRLSLSFLAPVHAPADYMRNADSFHSRRYDGQLEEERRRRSRGSSASQRRKEATVLQVQKTSSSSFFSILGSEEEILRSLEEDGEDDEDHRRGIQIEDRHIRQKAQEAYERMQTLLSSYYQQEETIPDMSLCQ